MRALSHHPPTMMVVRRLARLAHGVLKSEYTRLSTGIYTCHRPCAPCPWRHSSLSFGRTERKHPFCWPPAFLGAPRLSMHTCWLTAQQAPPARRARRAPRLLFHPHAHAHAMHTPCLPSTPAPAPHTIPQLRAGRMRARNATNTRAKPNMCTPPLGLGCHYLLACCAPPEH